MIVVADTSPLNYLLQINCESALSVLYKRIIIPSAVLVELTHPGTPAVVSSWLLHLPEWIEVLRTASPPDPSLALLDPGEREAIQLAQEHHAALLLIDERRGRMEAQRRGLATTGTLGVILTAHLRGLLNAEGVYRQLLTTTNFRSTPELESRFLQRVRGLGDR
jgi:predicted nucleic acid-binding protein